MNWYRPLTGGWTLAPAPGVQPAPAASVGRVAATVPGCVHTDLLAAGRIPDPFLDDNEIGLAWIGRTDWVYETTLEWDPADAATRVDLVCAGLDTVATITLNGTEVGRTANMHRGYRFDVRGLLRPGANDLRVHFDSPYRYAQRMEDALGDRPAAYREPFNFIRKMACNFGWDWGPTLVTAGIWQEIGLHGWSGARLAEVRPLVTVDGADGGATGHVEAHVTIERAGGDGPVTVAAEIAGARAAATIAAGQNSAVLSLTVPDVDLWWPRGHGDQPLYDLAITVDGGGRWSRRVGFRDVRLDTTPDEHGTPYTLLVNGVPVFVRGMNWIPDDVFVTRITRERLAHRFAQACAANVNYLRIWGGGRYESEDFYELADELGVLVGQDFLFACAAYPEEEPFAAEVAAEAREQVVRLASHPSLVTWTGNNENIWGHEDWNWKPELAGRTWGAGFYFDVLPAIVAELDPTRPYWPGSPYSGSDEHHPNDPSHGTMHIWDVWNTDDYTRYREYSPRFVAEFGYQAPPAYATLRRSISDEALAPESPGMRHHQKAVDGDAKLRRGLDAHLPAPRDFDDWHYLTQLNQARAIALAVERYRSQRPVCMGTIVWQLNDCWPVTSWAAVDGDGRRKPLWYALRRLYADRLLTIQPAGGGLSLVAVNESGGPWLGEVTVARVALTGEPLAKTTVDLAVGGRSARSVPLPADLVTADEPHAELLIAYTDDGEERALHFFAEDKDVAYPRAAYAASVEPAGEGATRVTVTARTILRDLTLFPDRLDPSAEVDRALVTLLPGESATFTVTGGAALDPEALTTRPVLRCVNDIAGGELA